MFNQFPRLIPPRRFPILLSGRNRVKPERLLRNLHAVAHHDRRNLRAGRVICGIERRICFARHKTGTNCPLHWGQRSGGLHHLRCAGAQIVAVDYADALVFCAAVDDCDKLFTGRGIVGSEPPVAQAVHNAMGQSVVGVIVVSCVLIWCAELSQDCAILHFGKRGCFKRRYRRWRRFWRAFLLLSLFPPPT